MKILTPNEVRQPLGAAIIKPPEKKDWEAKLGAKERPDINESANWTESITEYELQRNRNFDNYSCVTFSLFNKVQCIIKHSWDIKTDWSKRASAVLNGTKQRQGNTVNAPCEHLRRVGAWLEKDYPTMTPNMTEADYFKKVPQEIIDKECFKKDWKYNHEYLPRYDGKLAKLDVLKRMLKKSPIMVSVEGRYSFNKGRIVWGGGRVAHEVLLVNIKGDTAYILDSENDHGLLPFDTNYKFHYPKVGFVHKLKNSNMDFSKFLIRNADNGRIYMIGSDNIIHHIVSPGVFIEYFGKPAWENKNWIDSDTRSMSHLQEGEPLTKSNRGLFNAIVEAISNFGKN